MVVVAKTATSTPTSSTQRVGHIARYELDQPAILYDRLQHLKIKGQPNTIELPSYYIFEAECYRCLADESIRHPERVLTKKLRNKFQSTESDDDCHQQQYSKPEESKDSGFSFKKLYSILDKQVEDTKTTKTTEHTGWDESTINALNRCRERRELAENLKNRVAPATQESA